MIEKVVDYKRFAIKKVVIPILFYYPFFYNKIVIPIIFLLSKNPFEERIVD